VQRATFLALREKKKRNSTSRTVNHGKRKLARRNRTGLYISRVSTNKTEKY
jgi:hypothetical protein